MPACEAQVIAAWVLQCGASHSLPLLLPLPILLFPAPCPSFPFSFSPFPLPRPSLLQRDRLSTCAVPEPSAAGSPYHLQTLFPGASCPRCPRCLPSPQPAAPLHGGQTSLAPPLLLFGALSLSKKTSRCKTLQRAHPALFMLAAGPFALFYPASLIRTRDFFGLKKSAVFPLLPPPIPAPWKFR